MSSRRGECTFLTSRRIMNIDCYKTFYCICEMRIDRIVSVNCMRIRKGKMECCHFYLIIRLICDQSIMEIERDGLECKDFLMEYDKRDQMTSFFLGKTDRIVRE
jgi:hypothetical protein